MPLVLIESPNKVSKLKDILGQKYKIMASVGHIMDLSKNDLGVNLDTFDLTYKLNADKKEVISNIKREIDNHDVIYLATDPDREGEAIAFHLSKLIPDGKKYFRVKFNAITKDVVLKAIKSPGSLDEKLFAAQKARRVTDRVVGFKVSPVMWNKGLVGTSAGRVQSVALKYIADRESEIRNFKPEEYWNVSSSFVEKFDAEMWGLNGKKKELPDKAAADKILEIINNADSIIVKDVQAKSKPRSPNPPFTTSTLQQAASSEFGWSAKKTMEVAQSIFGHGLITYHRTDSTRIDPGKLDELREKIENTYGKKYLSPSVIQYGAKNGAQDAHEAIRPTYEQPMTTLDKDEKKLLNLIDSRYTASQMADAIFDKVSVQIEVAKGSQVVNLKRNGSSMAFDGFLSVYGEKQDDLILPNLTIGQPLSLSSASGSQHFTRPPARHSDASIVKILEKDGVGRPSTYASILDTLFERDYIVRNGNTLHATEVGMMVSEYLSKNFPKIVDPQFTSKMEGDLDKIAEGLGDYKEILTDFCDNLECQVSDALNGSIPDSFLVDTCCNKCSSKMIKRISKNGPYLGCSTWPICDGVKEIDGEDSKERVVETGHKCPQCSNIMILRDGKNGKFYGCKSYPECKVTAKVSDSGKPVFQVTKPDEKEIKCEKCNKGLMHIKEGKFGKFLGCSRYPKCNNIAKL